MMTSTYGHAQSLIDIERKTNMGEHRDRGVGWEVPFVPKIYLKVLLTMMLWHASVGKVSNVRDVQSGFLDQPFTCESEIEG
jgi:hypothetical protein